MKIIAELKRRTDSSSSILLYPSSCPYHESLQLLPVDTVILCSNDFTISTIIGKVFCIKCDNNFLLRLLYESNIRVSIAALINDGCVEGGNYECTNTATFFGRLLPVMHETFYVITDHGTSNGFFDVPVDAAIASMPRSLIPLIRRSGPRSRPIFWQVSKIAPRTYSISFENITVHVVHDSIINFLDYLDLAIFFSQKPEGFAHYFDLDFRLDVFSPLAFLERRPNDMFFLHSFRGLLHFIQLSRNRSLTLGNALNFACRHGLNSIGFVPFAHDRYEYTCSVLSSYSRKHPSEVFFFHLNQADYSNFASLLGS